MAQLWNLLSPFKWYLLAMLILATTGTTWRVLDWRSDAHLLKSEKDAHSKDIENCAKIATVTKDLGHDYTSAINRIDAGYIGLLETNCAGVSIAHPAGGNNGAACPNQPAGLTIKQKRLNDKQATQLIGLQATTRVIYNVNGKGDLLPVP